uniref:Reverse transcriptase domain-containing protein n=1 Tax=Cannabis sativa TaxID=3483 RepID=A0A803NWF8_CANSA
METQSAFVEGRQILDSILIANESVEDYRSRGKSGMVFKLDFKKAYDRVEWDFLDSVMRNKGFGVTCRKWIKGCVSSTSFSIFINGRPREKFHGSWGLRQGDPLSPFLFTLVVDVLGRMMEKAAESELKPVFNLIEDSGGVFSCKFAFNALTSGHSEAGGHFFLHYGWSEIEDLKYSLGWFRSRFLAEMSSAERRAFRLCDWVYFTRSPDGERG